MTLLSIQQELRRQHGNDWPKYALYRFAELRGIEKAGGLGYNESMFREYQLLSQWLFNTVEAGIAFNQTGDF